MSKNIAPKLRFPEFDKVWTTKKVGELCDSIVPGRNKPKIFDGDIPWITTPDITHNEVIKNSKNGLGISKEIAKTIGSKIVPAESIVMSCVGDLGLVAYTENEIVINQQLHAFIPKGQLYWRFLLYALSIRKKYMERVATKTAVLYLNKDNCNSVPISYPQLSEQRKIAEFLGAVDAKLDALRRKRALLAEYKRGVMQKLFTQEIRFVGDGERPFPDWEEGRIDSFVERVSKPVSVDLEKSYRQIGVRSHGKGIFHKPPVTGRELGNKRVFWVHPRAFVVNIVFGWEQAVAVTSDAEDGFIASHRFPMFVPRENKIDLDFILLFFLRKYGKHLLGLASPGGAGSNKTLGQNNFAELKVTIPCIDEQRKIANFAKAIDNKITAVDQQIEQMETFKKGLLQQMFV